MVTLTRSQMESVLPDVHFISETEDELVALSRGGAIVSQAGEL